MRQQNELFAENPNLARLLKGLCCIIFLLSILRGIFDGPRGMVAEWFLTAFFYCMSKTLETNPIKNVYFTVGISFFVINRLVDNEYFIPRGVLGL